MSTRLPRWLATFGEGSVLERDGEWTRLRDGAAEPINSFDRIGLEDLTAEVFDFEPMDLLGYATSMIRQAGPLTGELISTLADAAWPEAQMLGCALEWLTAGELTHLGQMPVAPGAWPQNRPLLDFIIDHAHWDS